MFFFLSNLLICVWTLSIISADYMPLQPLEDEDDTVINFLYPLEPPVRFLIYFSEEYYSPWFLTILLVGPSNISVLDAS
jgi:hypothetical protein